MVVWNDNTILNMGGNYNKLLSQTQKKTIFKTRITEKFNTSFIANVI